ncbi:hypothetical protein YC2023_098474 [Brassica napus]
MEPHRNGGNLLQVINLRGRGNIRYRRLYSQILSPREESPSLSSRISRILRRSRSCKLQFREESSDDEPNHPVASSSRRCGNHASDFEADKKNKREHGEVSHHLIAKRGAFREKPKTKVTSFSSEKTSPAASLELELSVQSLQSAHQLVGDRDLGDAMFLSTEPLHRTLVQFCISGPENFKGTSFMSKKSSPVESIELELPAQTKPQSQSQYKL